MSASDAPRAAQQREPRTLTESERADLIDRIRTSPDAATLVRLWLKEAGITVVPDLAPFTRLWTAEERDEHNIEVLRNAGYSGTADIAERFFREDREANR